MIRPTLPFRGQGSGRGRGVSTVITPGQTSADASNLNPDGTLSPNPNPTYGLEIDLNNKSDVRSLLVSYIASVSGQYGIVDAYSGVDYTKLTPYLVTITRNTDIINYPRMRQMGVSGLMLEVGNLYNQAHVEHWDRNPKLIMQAKEAEQQGFPYGIFTTGRARTVEEAEKEMYYFSFAIRKNPPKLGAWIELGLVRPKVINDQIVNTYYNELVRLGLKSKIGFYATSSQLSLISWDTHSKEWLLWLNRHVMTMVELGDQITPQFFVV